MSREQSFLVTYGLHNFVTHTLKPGVNTFFIKSKESQNMISHAKALIEGGFGNTVDIQVV